MLEILLIPAAIGAIGLLSPRFNKKSDQKKLDTLFYNTGMGVREKGKENPTYPKCLRKSPIKEGEKIIGTCYTYSLPLGITSKLMKVLSDGKVFEDGLNKPVEVEYQHGALSIRVYEEDIPDIFRFTEIPEVRNKWVIPLGKTYDGIMWHNFDHTPHMTMGGVTRFGKTVFLKVMMTYLILCHPKDVEFYIIDLKGGLEFHRYKGLEQVKYVASNKVEAYKILNHLSHQINETMEYYKSKYWTNVTNTPINKRTFIIVDEGAQIMPSGKNDKLRQECKELLEYIAAVSGGLGYRLIFCTQYPTGDNLPKDVKQNADLKVSFRVPTQTASMVTIDQVGAEELPSQIKGRALIKTHELKEVQAPLLEDEEMWELLARYEIPKILDVKPDDVVEHAEETTTRGGNIVKLR